MPYGKYPEKNQICIYKQDAEGNPIGESLGCHPTEGEADAQLAALYASESMTIQLPAADNLMDTRYFMGGAVRAMGDGIIEGYLVPFNTKQTKDFYNTYFDRHTNYMLDDYPIVQRAYLIYHHGLDTTLSVRNLGDFIRKRLDDVGIWVQAQLDLRDEWEQEVYKLAQNGKLGWSSGALPQAVEIDDDGHVRTWPIIEGSLTPQPAAVPFASQIYTRSSYQDVLRSAKDGNAREESTLRPVEIQTDNEKQPKQEKQPMADNNRNLADVAQMVQQALDMLMEYVNAESGQGGEPMPAAAQEEMATALQTQMSAKLDEMQEQMKEWTPDKVRGWVETSLADALPGVVDQYHKNRAAREKQLRAAAKNAFRQVEPEPAPGYVRTNNTHSMSVSEPRRYWGRDLKQLLFAYQVMRAAKMPVSEDMLRTLAGRTEIGLEKHETIVDNPYVRSILPAYRADEIVTSTNSGNGDEWIGVAYSNQLWEVARSSIIMDALISKDMVVEEVPQGYETVTIFTEGSDPTVYSLTQSADLDATLRPTVIVPVTAPGTGQVTLTPGHLGAAVAFTTVFEEDSLIQAAPQFTRQMDIKARETIDQLFINGDTEAGTTNVNYDGSSAAAITAYYKASNGARKYALVTGSSTSRSGGALDDDDYRLTLALMPTAVQERNEGMVFIVDVATHNQSLDILATKTQDVRGSAATIDTGLIRALYGVDLFRSGFLPLTASDGKVTYNAAGTLGSILCIYAPYWAMGWKRHIKTETDYDPLQQTFTIVNTMRLGFVPRGAGAAVISYNLTVGA